MASKWPAVRRMLKWELIKLIMAVIVCAILFLYMRSVVGPKLTKVMHDMTNPSKAPVERKK